MNIKKLWDELEDSGRANLITICIAPFLFLLSIVCPNFFWENIGGFLMVAGILWLLGWLFNFLRR